MNLLITGCAGFIGSHFVEHALLRGNNIVGVDILSYAGSFNNMKSFFDKIEFHKLDINNTKTIDEIVKKSKIDYVINFAAETHVDNSITSPQKFIDNNLTGVLSLLEVCKNNNVKLLQISTDEVYGSIEKGSFSECSMLNPQNPYAASKSAAEHMITAYNNTHDVDYKIVRMSNNFGPRQHVEKFIPKILSSLAKKQKIPLYGDGQNVRDWLYVKDCVAMIIDILEKGDINAVYNITLKNEITNVDLLKTILQILDLDFKKEVSYVIDRKGHDKRYSICNKKYKKIKNRKPTEFIASLKETINSF